MAVGGGVVVVAVGFTVGVLLTTIGCCVGIDRFVDGSLDSLLFAPPSEGVRDGPSEDTREGSREASTVWTVGAVDGIAAGSAVGTDADIKEGGMVGKLEGSAKGRVVVGDNEGPSNGIKDGERFLGWLDGLADGASPGFFAGGK
jgi:hypothetical protein